MRYDLRAMGVGAILDRGLRLYIDNFGILLAISLVFSVPVAALELFLSSATGSDRLEQTLVALLVGLAAGAGIVAFIQGALVSAVSDIYLGAPASIGRSLRTGAVRAIPLLIGIILYSIITTVGFAFCILPGVVLMGALFAVVPIIVLERRGPIDAIARSWELSSGMRLRAFAAIFFAQLQPALVSYVVAIPAAMLEMDQLKTQAMTHLAVALVQPYAAVVLILLYYDFRVRREAFDLQVLAVELGRSRPAPAPAPPANP